MIDSHYQQHRQIGRQTTLFEQYNEGTNWSKQWRIVKICHSSSWLNLANMTELSPEIQQRQCLCHPESGIQRFAPFDSNYDYDDEHFDRTHAHPNMNQMNVETRVTRETFNILRSVVMMMMMMISERNCSTCFGFTAITNGITDECCVTMMMTILISRIEWWFVLIMNRTIALNACVSQLSIDFEFFNRTNPRELV